jgi:polyisoprenoid-binding protein YceI
MIRHFAAAALSLIALPIHATTYTIEPDHAQGVFRWNHLGFSFPAGQFSRSEGTLEFDSADPAKSSVKVTIPLSSLQTGVPALDEDLKSDQFFDVAKFPTASFESSKVQKTAMAGHLQLIGNLNLHGVVKPVTLGLTVVKVGTNPRSGLPTVGFDATTTLRRSDFGLGAYVPQVGDDIEIRIIIEAVEAKAYSQYLKEKAKEEAKAGESTQK